jgi:hypothetical protein
LLVLLLVLQLQLLMLAQQRLCMDMLQPLASACSGLPRTLLVTPVMVATQPWQPLEGGRQHTPLLLLPCLLLLVAWLLLLLLRRLLLALGSVVHLQHCLQPTALHMRAALLVLVLALRAGTGRCQVTTTAATARRQGHGRGGGPTRLMLLLLLPVWRPQRGCQWGHWHPW